MKTHISGMMVEARAEYIPDDDLWLIRGLIDNGKNARPDNEFYVRMTPCAAHKTSADQFQSGILFLSNLPNHLLKKAMDIGIEVLGNNGFLPDSGDDDGGE